MFFGTVSMYYVGLFDGWMVWSLGFGVNGEG